MEINSETDQLTIEIQFSTVMEMVHRYKQVTFGRLL